MKISLTMSELQQAVIAGGNRRIHRLAGRRGADKYNLTTETNRWDLDIEAAAAEMAVAKVTGLYWAARSSPDYEGDIGHGLQVRHTQRLDGRLIVHDEDEDDHRFVLVRGTAPTFDVAGAIRGADAKDKRWWHEFVEGRPAYFVPAEALTEVRFKS